MKRTTLELCERSMDWLADSILDYPLRFVAVLALVLAVVIAGVVFWGDDRECLHGHVQPIVISTGKTVTVSTVFICDEYAPEADR